MRILVIIFFYVVLLVIPFVIKAQVYTSSPNPPGKFTVTQVRGCVPFTVEITAPDCDGTVGCGMLHDINDPVSTGKEFLNGDPTKNTLTYSVPGTYTLALYIGTQENTIQITALPNTPPKFEAYACKNNEVFLKITDTSYDGGYIVEYPNATKPLASGATDIQAMPSGDIKVRGLYTTAADNCTPSVQAVQVYASLSPPPITRLAALNASAVELNFTDQPSVLYRTQIATNSNTAFQNLPNVANANGTLAITSNVSPDNNYYCFRMTTINNCDNIVGPTFSNTICSVNFDAVAANNQNEFSWVTNATGVVSNDITRNTTPLPATTVASKIDTDIICNTPYTYQLIANYSGAQSISLPKTVTSFSNDVPPPINNITTAVQANGGVQLTWLPEPLVSNYFVYRSTESSAIDTTTTENSIDTQYSGENTFCYRVRYTNTCGNAGPVGLEACPLQLTGQVQKDNSIVVTWQPYTGWQNGVSAYSVEKYTADGQLLQTFSIAGTETTLTDNVPDLTNQTYVYIVKAEANDSGLGVAISNPLTIIKQPNIFYPAAFSPNSDGLNDKFIVFGQFVTIFEMKIFNRWGELMFSTDALDQGWDGNYKGIAMPEGTYAFVANLTDTEGRTFKRSGSIVLLRKK